MSTLLAFPTISPVPDDVLRDWSGGHRARVTVHAIRRYVERCPRWRLGDLFDDVADKHILWVLRSGNVPVDDIRDRLAYFGGVAVRCGGIGVAIDGVGLVVVDGVVRTVLSRRISREVDR